MGSFCSDSTACRQNRCAAPAIVSIAFGVCITFLMLPTTVVQAANLVWTSLPDNKIGYANLKDLSTTALPISGVSEPFAIAVDATNNNIYLGDSAGGKIFRANLDGSELTPLVTVTLPRQIALDVEHGKMYYSAEGDHEGYLDSLYRANLDGSNIETLVTGLWNPRAMVLDLDHGKMYFDSFDLGVYQREIQRADLDGSNVEHVAWTQGHSSWFLDLDTVHSTLYWANPVENAVWSVGIDGGDPVCLFSNLNMTPASVTVDSLTERIYVAGQMFSALPGSGGILRAGLDGTEAEYLFAGNNFWHAALYPIPEPAVIVHVLVLCLLVLLVISRRRGSLLIQGE